MNTKLYTYYIGCNDKDERMQTSPTLVIMNKVAEVLIGAGIDSFTMSKAFGWYKGEREQTIKLEVQGCRISEYYLQVIKEELNQECILEVVSEVESKLY